VHIVNSTLKVAHCYCQLRCYRMSILPILCIAAALRTIGCAAIPCQGIQSTQDTHNQESDTPNGAQSSHNHKIGRTDIL
jgi:hypothetical protein